MKFFSTELDSVLRDEVFSNKFSLFRHLWTLLQGLCKAILPKLRRSLDSFPYTIVRLLSYFAYIQMRKKE